MFLDQDRSEDVVIVGAGPIGIACAIAALKRGMDPLLIDAGAVVNSIVHYPIGMTFFTTPELLEVGGHPFPCAAQKPTREESIRYYRGVVRNEQIRVSTYTRLLAATRHKSFLECKVANSGGELRLRCQRVILASGYFDHPNLMEIPGEDLPHVRHYFDEAHRSYDQDVVVIGGRNSAAESALALFRAGARTTLVYRGTEFPRSIKYWIKPDLLNRIQAGEIQARLGAQVMEIRERHVSIELADGTREEIPAERVYALTGYHPDHDLFRSIGIQLDPDTLCPQLNEKTQETNIPGIYMAGSITAGHKISEIFIENGRFDGEKIFAEY